MGSGSPVQVVRAPRGGGLSCLGWQQEAAMRMLMNNLDPDVAERAEDLVVYGGAGKAARDWECYAGIVATLQRLRDDQTLLVQSGKPVGVFETHPGAPRVLIANANLVPEWATWPEFRRLDALGLTMYGQMTAGSWIYIGTQGILQGTYQTFAAAAEKHFGGSLAGRIVLTAGLGGMGGAQPLAVTMNGGVVALHRSGRRAYPAPPRDRLPGSLQHLVGRSPGLRAAEAKAGRQALSIGLLGNGADVVPGLVRRGFVPDMVTDQTCAHDTLNGYVPNGMPYEQALALRGSDADEYARRAVASVVEHVAAMLALQRAGAQVFDYGNNIRGVALEAGCADAFSFPGFVPDLHPAVLLPRQRAVSLGGALRRPGRHRAHRPRRARALPDNESLTRWMRMAPQQGALPGPAGAHLLARLRRTGHDGRALNELVARGEVKAPIVIGRDHLDAGSVASPYRETEDMLDGSDAIADWPLLNALLNTAQGRAGSASITAAAWAWAIRIHAGMVVVADGTAAMGERLQRVLTTDPGIGVMRHADAGYPEAVAAAREGGLDLPMVKELRT